MATTEGVVMALVAFNPSRDLEQLRLAVLGRLAGARSPILGSFLGNVIKVAAAGQDLEVKFDQIGGLKAFVEAYFGDVLRHQPGGADIQFELIQVAGRSPGPQPGTATQWEEVSLDKGRFWSAFTNPSSEDQLAYVGTRAKLFIGRPPLPEGGVPVRGITRVDYLGFARDFASARMPGSSKVAALELLGTVDPQAFLTKWLNLLKAHRTDSKDWPSEWERYRVERATEELRRRLQSRQVPSQYIDTLLQLLTSSYAAGKALRATLRAHQEPSADTARSPSTSLVELARRVVGRMSEDQIRDLRLPLGLVLEEIQRPPLAK